MTSILLLFLPQDQRFLLLQFIYTFYDLSDFIIRPATMFVFHHFNRTFFAISMFSTNSRLHGLSWSEQCVNCFLFFWLCLILAFCSLLFTKVNFTERQGWLTCVLSNTQKNLTSDAIIRYCETLPNVHSPPPTFVTWTDPAIVNFFKELELYSKNIRIFQKTAPGEKQWNQESFAILRTTNALNITE